MSKLKDNIQIQEKENDELEIDILELVYYFRTQAVLLLIVCLAGGLLAGGVTHFFITPKYQATSKLYMVSASNDSIVDLTDLNLGTSLSEDYTELLRIRPIIEEVIEDCRLEYSYEEVLDMLAISTLGETRILTITVESTSAEEAKRIANTLAAKAVTYLPKLMEISPPNIAENAIVPEAPSSPSLVKNVVLGAVGALFLTMAVLTVFFTMDDTMKSAEEVEKAFGVMPLTVVPEGDIEEISDKREEELRRERRRRRKRRKRREEIQQEADTKKD